MGKSEMNTLWNRQHRVLIETVFGMNEDQWIGMTKIRWTRMMQNKRCDDNRNSRNRHDRFRRKRGGIHGNGNRGNRDRQRMCGEKGVRPESGELPKDGIE